MLICPHCGAPLVRKDKTFCCESGHSYDIARAGYCNLLQTNKPGDHTGDSKEMVEARRRFLDQGYYEGLAMAMCQQMKNLTKDKADINFVDAGCGVNSLSGLQNLQIQSITLRRGLINISHQAIFVSYCPRQAFTSLTAPTGISA